MKVSLDRKGPFVGLGILVNPAYKYVHLVLGPFTILVPWWRCPIKAQRVFDKE